MTDIWTLSRLRSFLFLLGSNHSARVVHDIGGNVVFVGRLPMFDMPPPSGLPIAAMVEKNLVARLDGSSGWFNMNGWSMRSSKGFDTSSAPAFRPL
jgi:hypothetical protein